MALADHIQDWDWVHLDPDKIKLARIKARMLQKQLAESTGRTQQAVTRWEAAPTRLRMFEVRRIAEVLGTSSESLVQMRDSGTIPTTPSVPPGKQGPRTRVKSSGAVPTVSTGGIRWATSINGAHASRRPAEAEIVSYPSGVMRAFVYEFADGIRVCGMTGCGRPALNIMVEQSGSDVRVAWLCNDHTSNPDG